MSLKNIQQFTHQDIEIKQQETLYQGFVRLDKFSLRHKLFAGGWSPAFTREVFSRSDAVGIVLYDPYQRKTLLVEQFRMGALLNAPHSPWLLEIVAGLIDKDESPETVVHREAQEEAGIAIQELLPITTYWASPGAFSERVSLYCGKVDVTHAGGIHGVEGEHEDIRIHVVDVEEAYAAVRSGLICNSLTIIGIQWLQLNEAWLQEQWQKR